jgi:hypothetical protein
VAFPTLDDTEGRVPKQSAWCFKLLPTAPASLLADLIDVPNKNMDHRRPPIQWKDSDPFRGIRSAADRAGADWRHRACEARGISKVKVRSAEEKEGNPHRTHGVHIKVGALNLAPRSTGDTDDISAPGRTRMLRSPGSDFNYHNCQQRPVRSSKLAARISCRAGVFLPRCRSEMPAPPWTSAEAARGFRLMPMAELGDRSFLKYVACRDSPSLVLRLRSSTIDGNLSTEGQP